MRELSLPKILEYFSTFGQITHVQPFLNSKNEDSEDFNRIRICFGSEDITKEILQSPRHSISGKSTRVVRSRPPTEKAGRFIPTQEIETSVIKVSKEEVGIFPEFLTVFGISMRLQISKF